MDNIAGSPVEGENFYGREAAVAHLRENLGNDDILLLGPRRIGKTSTARAIMATLRADGWRAIEINVASCVDERGFLDKLDAALTPELASITTKAKEAIVDSFGKIGGRIKSLKISVPGAGAFGVELGNGESEDWTKVASDVLRLIAQADERWLIYVDELPIFLFNIIHNDQQNGVQRVRRFLDWFRNDVRALPDAHKVRWLISGSIGLDTLVQEHGMADTINSLSHQGLAPFSHDVAASMLMELAVSYQIKLTNEDTQKIVLAVQWAQPYYLQVAFHHLRVLMGENSNVAVTDLIDSAIDNMVKPGADNDFHHWEQRLRLQLRKADADHALALLNQTSHDPAGVQPDTLLAMLQERMHNTTAEEARHTFIRLRDILLRDAYWMADESSGVKRYRFCLEPLRRWWLRRDTL